MGPAEKQVALETGIHACPQFPRFEVLRLMQDFSASPVALLEDWRGTHAISESSLCIHSAGYILSVEEVLPDPQFLRISVVKGPRGG